MYCNALKTFASHSLADSLTQREPADHLLTLHAALVVDGRHERHVRQLEERHLEHERLLVERVGLAAADRRLAARDLLTVRRHERQLHVRVCTHTNNEIQHFSPLLKT